MKRTPQLKQFVPSIVNAPPKLKKLHHLRSTTLELRLSRRVSMKRTKYLVWHLGDIGEINKLFKTNMNEWCFRPPFCTVRLYWAGDKRRPSNIHLVLFHLIFLNSDLGALFEVGLDICIISQISRLKPQHSTRFLNAFIHYSTVFKQLHSFIHQNIKVVSETEI